MVERKVHRGSLATRQEIRPWQRLPSQHWRQHWSTVLPDCKSSPVAVYQPSCNEKESGGACFQVTAVPPPFTLNLIVVSVLYPLQRIHFKQKKVQNELYKITHSSVVVGFPLYTLSINYSSPLSQRIVELKRVKTWNTGTRKMADRLYYPNPEIAKNAHCSSMEQYRNMHEK